MPTVILAGCQIEPLGSFLKALGVLRLVSKQVDEEARGYWKGSCFTIESRLDAEGLVTHLLEEYEPTPVVAPWNGGSGFYPKDRKVGIDGIANSASPRFSTYRRTISLCRSLPELATGEKAPKKADEDVRRAAIQRACRNALPDEAVDWLDAAVAITAGGERRFPPILGTGGNEGRLDYTNNFMERLVNVLIRPGQARSSEELLRNALFGGLSRGFENAAAGQFDPGRAGGFNQGEGVESKDIPTNPWNYILTVEGAVGWASGLYRRQSLQHARSYLCSPFTVRPSSVGYNSATSQDTALARAEIWTPIWRRPTTWAEIECLLREGRAQVSGRPAQNGLQFAQAAASLGVDRGIDGFVRYSLLKRRGDSYVALPASRFPVRGVPKVHLLEQLDRVFERLNWLKGRSKSLDSARRRLDDAIYEFLLRGDGNYNLHFQRMTAALGRVCREVLLRPADSTVSLPPDLSISWIEGCAGQEEGRIAAALAMIQAEDQADAGRAPRLRENLTRTEDEFAWEGLTLTERMVKTLQRRVMTANRGEAKGGALWSPLMVNPSDISQFLEEVLDDELIENLLFAFLLVRPVRRRPQWWERPVESRAVPTEYALLKLLFHPNFKSAGGARLNEEPRVIPLLKANRIREACEIAQRRLVVSGRPPERVRYRDHESGGRLAAALLIPTQLYFEQDGETNVLWHEVLKRTEEAVH